MVPSLFEKFQVRPHLYFCFNWISNFVKTLQSDSFH